MEVLLLAMIGL